MFLDDDKHQRPMVIYRYVKQKNKFKMINKFFKIEIWFCLVDLHEKKISHKLKINLDDVKSMDYCPNISISSCSDIFMSENKSNVFYQDFQVAI